MIYVGMGYLHIHNLYKDQTILLFKEVYALEKIHGTSSHITFTREPATLAPEIPPKLTFFSGGESHQRFCSLFDADKLFEQLKVISPFPGSEITIFGEAYGGNQQGMSQTYGNKLCFCAFDVQIGDCWLDVPVAEQIVTSLGLEFVPYKRINTDIDSLNAAKDEDSEIAIRRGMGPGKKREGVVLRPLKEMVLNNKDRVIVKHKRDEFRETVSPRVIDDPAKLKILEGAQVIAVEWTTPARLQHVLDKIPGHSMEKMRDIILAMQEDVKREADNEIVWSEPARKAIGSRTAQLYKTFLQSSIDNQPKLS